MDLFRTPVLCVPRCTGKTTRPWTVFLATVGVLKLFSLMRRRGKGELPGVRSRFDRLAGGQTAAEALFELSLDCEPR